VLLTALAFAPNDLFAVYTWVARFGSPLFVIYQMVIFIDFGYTLNEKLTDKDDNEDALCCLSNSSGNAYKGVMLMICIGLVVAAITGTVVLYHWYPSACAFNATAITTAWLFSLINFCVTVSPIAEHGTILVASLLFLYAMYTAFSAVSAFPEEECNPFVHDHAQDETRLVLSSAMTIASIAWMAYKMGSRKMGENAYNGKGSGADQRQAQNVDDATSNGHDVVANDAVTVHVETSAGIANVPEGSYAAYHFVFICAALYSAMLVTDWGSTSSVDNSHARHNVGYASAWLILSSMWVCQALYLWTLMAPWLFPDRDFSS